MAGNDKALAEQMALVTGSGTGIGRAFAEHLREIVSSEQ
jgi:NAD(P)-dependent dehydrogenase (short-subunit alcohol dehydrogenase family)